MSKGLWTKLLWMAALVPLFGASVLPTHMRALVCRLSGALMDEEACCPASNEKQAPPAARLLDQGCCEVRTVALPKLLSDQQANGSARWDSQTPLSKLTAELPARQAVDLPLHRVRPPPVGPPLRLLKRSFLI